MLENSQIHFRSIRSKTTECHYVHMPGRQQMSLLSWNLLFRERAQITRYLESCIRKQSEEGEEGCNSTSEDLKVAGVHRHLGTCTPGQRRGARDARAPGMFGGGPGDRSDGVQQGRRVKQVSQSVTEKGPPVQNIPESRFFESILLLC